MRRTKHNGEVAPTDNWGGGFDRRKAAAMRSVIDAKLAELSQATGLQFSIGNIKFNDAEMSTRLTVTCPERAQDHLRRDWEVMARHYGLKPEWFGKSFTQGGKTFTIVRLDTKKRRYPVICDRSDGKQYKFPESIVIGRMGDGEPGVREAAHRTAQAAAEAAARAAYPMTDDFKNLFLSIAVQLSPENLTCDGELPPAAVRVKKAALQSKWADLEKKFGRKVDESEVWE